MKEIDERRLVSRDKVICRRCKGTVASYEKARKALIKRLLDSNQRLSTASLPHTPTSIVTNERPSTASSPHTPIATVSRKRSGLASQSAVAPKRLCLTENNDNSPAVMVSL